MFCLPSKNSIDLRVVGPRGGAIKQTAAAMESWLDGGGLTTLGVWPILASSMRCSAALSQLRISRCCGHGWRGQRFLHREPEWSSACRSRTWPSRIPVDIRMAMRCCWSAVRPILVSRSMSCCYDQRSSLSSLVSILASSSACLVRISSLNLSIPAQRLTVDSPAVRNMTVVGVLSC